MGGQDFTQFATGISGSLFGGMLQDRQDKQKREDEELARQLAAYQALMAHPETPNSEVVNLLRDQARLLKNEKQMEPILSKMAEAMKRQVPSGPERETLDSRVGRAIDSHTDIGPTERVIDVQPNFRPMIPLGGNQPTPTPSSAVPLGGVPPEPGSPITVSTPALSRVPTEPTMYQPTREYSTLTQGESADLRKGQLYGTQQDAMLRRQLAIQGEADEGRLERERLRVDAARKLEETKQTGRIAAIQKTYDEKTKMLAPAAQAKMNAERVTYQNSLMAGGMPEQQAEVASYNLFRAQVDTQLAVQKQKVEESKERMKRMGVQNAESWERIRKSKDTRSGLYEGMSAGTKREFDLRTGSLQSELTSTFRQLEDAYKEAGGSPNPGEQASISRLEAKKDDLLSKIDGARQELVTRSAPQGTGDGKRHYSMGQIQSTIGPNGLTKNGKTLQQVITELQSRPGIVIDP